MLLPKQLHKKHQILYFFPTQSTTKQTLNKSIINVKELFQLMHTNRACVVVS